MSIQGEGDLQFRTDAVDARYENRVAHATKVGAKQSAEAADFSKHLRAVRLSDEGLNSPLESIPEIDIYTGASVSLSLLCHPERVRRISQAILDAMMAARSSRDHPVFARFLAPLGMTRFGYFKSANSVGCVSCSASAFARCSRFSMMNLSRAGSTGRG